MTSGLYINGDENHDNIRGLDAKDESLLIT